MKKIHCAFADDKFLKSLNILEESSILIGKVDRFVRYKPFDLQANRFWQDNQRILSEPLGAGYWIWKPFIILETMKLCKEGDIVLYTDAGVRVIDNLDPLFEITKTSKDNRMLFALTMNYGTHRHSEYTKRDCFVLMGQDDPKYHNERMLNAAFSVWMKTPKNILFLSEWQYYLKDSRVVTYEANTCGLPNLPDYIDHRHDQSVLSLLSLKYGRELYREPTQFTLNETYQNSPYGQLFDHHGGNI
jgi:hypothetical protein